jgi:hypothetical protein
VLLSVEEPKLVEQGEINKQFNQFGSYFTRFSPSTNLPDHYLKKITSSTRIYLEI